MIESLKKNMQQRTWSAKGIVAFILFGAIGLTFVFFGLPTHTNMGAATAGRVNNTLISLADFNSEVNRLQQMYAPMFGNAGLGDAQRQFIQSEALKSLINSEVIAQSANKAGLKVSDLEVKMILVNEVPAFQRDGRFQKDMYKQILEANQLTPADFEARIRKDRAAQKARQLIMAAAMPMKFEIEKQAKLASQQRNIEFVKFTKEAVLNSLESKISDADIQSALSSPEATKKIEDYFNANKNRWSVEEQVRAQHILIKSDGSPDGDKKALTRIQELKKRSEKEDFSTLAKESSEDLGSKTQGGDLGFFTKGRMVPEFEKVAFSEKPGQISEPVKSPFGYHLIKVIEKKAASQAEFTASKSSATKAYLAEEKFNQWQGTLEQNLKAKDLAVVNKFLSDSQLKWEETGLFDLAADMIPKLSPVSTTASYELKQSGEILDRLIRDGSDRWIVRLKEIKNNPVSSKPDQLVSLQQESAGDIFGAWVEFEKSQSKIEQNLNALTVR